MKKIGLIFALKEELEETKERIKLIQEHKIYDLTIYECKSGENECYLLVSGMGKVNAARATQILIDNMEVDYILNVGVAGSVSRKVGKCDIVIGDNLVQHDFDLTPLGREKGMIPNVGKFVKCDEKLIDIAKNVKSDSNVFIGNIASGDIFITSEKDAKEINENYNALCAEMEGAAIAQASYLSGVPFLVIRAISDSPYEKDNNITFEEFLKISSESVSKFVVEFLK